MPACIVPLLLVSSPRSSGERPLRFPAPPALPVQQAPKAQWVQQGHKAPLALTELPGQPDHKVLQVLTAKTEPPDQPASKECLVQRGQPAQPEPQV